MSNELAIYVLYLFYGLAFFTMGVAITTKDTSFSKLKIARILWLFALFAYTHALHEWTELYLIPHYAAVPIRLHAYVEICKLILVIISFCFLFQFGVGIIRTVFPQIRYSINFLLPLFLLLWSACLVGYGEGPHPAFFLYADLRMRNLIGFPAALISGIGFILFSRTIRDKSTKGALSFIGAGTGLIAYGALTGLVPSKTMFPFFGGIPVEFFRGLVTFFILHFLMNALHIFDIEQREIIEERLHRFAQSEKLTAMGKLAAGIAHEINNPLTNVSLNVELLKKSLNSSSDPEKHQKRFEAIQRNIDRASKIAQELLYFSREKETDFMLTDIREVIRSTLTLLGPRQTDFKINLELDETPVIDAIPWKLEEVFLNLIINAMEALPPGGEITVRSFADEKSVICEILDSGAGIPPETLNSIFDPFFTTKEVGKGTGLGLSICFGIMEMHGGRIEVESTINKGTRVALVFPRGGKDVA